MACGPVQRSVFIGGGRVVVSAYGIAGTKALPFQSRLENLHEPSRYLHQTTQCALIACTRRVDQDPALDWLTWHAGERVQALFQCAGRIAAINRDLRHQRVLKTMRHDIFGSFAFRKLFSLTSLSHAWC